MASSKFRNHGILIDIFVLFISSPLLFSLAYTFWSENINKEVVAMKDFEKNLFKVQNFWTNSHVSADICTLNIGYYDANLLSAMGFLSSFPMS